MTEGNLAPNSAIDQIQNYVLGGLSAGDLHSHQYPSGYPDYVDHLVLTLKWLNNNIYFVKRFD